MTSNRNIGLALVVIAIIAISGNVFPLSNNSSFGGTTNLDALTLDNGSLTLTSGNVAISNGNITIAKTTGTTTVSSLGCINVYATSTATVGHFVYNTQATTSLSGATVGVVGWQYGVCP